MQEAFDKLEENLPQLKSHGHSVAAFALHLIILLSADHPLKLIEPTNTMIGILVLVSGIATYKYFSNSKTYDVFNYEQVFQRLGGNLRNLGPVKDAEYFNGILC